MINGYKITLYMDEVNYLNPYWGTVYWGGGGWGLRLSEIRAWGQVFNGITSLWGGVADLLRSPLIYRTLWSVFVV